MFQLFFLELFSLCKIPSIHAFFIYYIPFIFPKRILAFYLSFLSVGLKSLCIFVHLKYNTEIKKVCQYFLKKAFTISLASYFRTANLVRK